MVHRNIWTRFGLETASSKRDTPPEVVEKDPAKILWDVQIKAERKVMENQLDMWWLW